MAEQESDDFKQASLSPEAVQAISDFGKWLKTIKDGWFPVKENIYACVHPELEERLEPVRKALVSLKVL